jgi:hypothetical protein
MSSKIISPGGGENVQVDITQTLPLICQCGNYTFQPVAFLRVLPALISPNGKEAIIPMMSYACNACGAVPDQTIPPFIRHETVKNMQAAEPTKSKLTLL